MFNKKQPSSPRKPRAVYNAYVDVDSISMAPGHNYCNWLLIAKQKLKERDIALISIKIDEIESIVNEELRSLNLFPTAADGSTNFAISKEIIIHSFRSLCTKIDEWNGANPLRMRTKSTFVRFRDLFKFSKLRWDQTKRKMIGRVFWIHVFHHIRHFVKDVGELSMLCITRSLFEATVKYNNTKSTLLINGGTVRCSSEIRHYLSCLHPILSPIQRFNHKDTTSTKAMMNTVRALLNTAVGVAQQNRVHNHKSHAVTHEHKRNANHVVTTGSNHNTTAVQMNQNAYVNFRGAQLQPLNLRNNAPMNGNGRSAPHASLSIQSQNANAAVNLNPNRSSGPTHTDPSIQSENTAAFIVYTVTNDQTPVSTKLIALVLP